MPDIKTLLRFGNRLQFPNNFNMTPSGAATHQEENEQSEQGTLNIILTPPDRLAKIDQIVPLTPGAAPRPNAVPSTLAIAYVAYRDGCITYYKGDRAVISSEFSGCLFSVYHKGAERRVAHIPKSDSSDNDCLPTFREKMESKEYRLVHYFEPFIKAEHSEIQMQLTLKGASVGLPQDPYSYTIMGVIGNDNKCYSVFVIKADKHNYDVVAVSERKPVDHVLRVRKKTS